MQSVLPIDTRRGYTRRLPIVHVSIPKTAERGRGFNQILNPRERWCTRLGCRASTGAGPRPHPRLRRYAWPALPGPRAFAVFVALRCQALIARSNRFSIPELLMLTPRLMIVAPHCAFSGTNFRRNPPPVASVMLFSLKTLSAYLQFQARTVFMCL